MAGKQPAGTGGAVSGPGSMGAAIEIDPQVRSMGDGEGAVLLHLETGKYHSLNGTGARIWSEIASGSTLAEILDRLAQTCEVPRDRLEDDVLQFVRGLEQRGLVRVRD